MDSGSRTTSSFKYPKGSSGIFDVMVDPECENEEHACKVCYAYSESNRDTPSWAGLIVRGRGPASRVWSSPPHVFFTWMHQDNVRVNYGVVCGESHTATPERRIGSK
jgi:hypothetical protein